MESNNEHPHGSHIVIPTTIFYLLISAALFGGAGSYSVFGPDQDREAINECRNTSKAALELGVQQARYIADLQDQLSKGTRDRFTQTEAIKHIQDQSLRDTTQDRRIDFIERRIGD